MEKFYSPQELANLLNVSHRAILKLIKTKRMRAINIAAGKRPMYKILDAEYQRFIREEYAKYEDD
jgi:excisionase family DNA binding protein